MSTRNGTAALIIAVLAAIGISTPASTQDRGVAIARRGDSSLGAGNLPLSRATSVMGFAWTMSNDPIPDATVRLRNVLTGRIEATSVTSRTGEFVFEDIEGGTYVVELVGENGRVAAVGQPFTVGPGETVATFVRLGPPASWFAGLFNNTAAAAVSSAASLGVTAVAPPQGAASPDR